MEAERLIQIEWPQADSTKLKQAQKAKSEPPQDKINKMTLSAQSDQGLRCALNG